MQHATPSGAITPDVTSTTPALDTAAAGERLSRLFSATLKQGRLHPLYMPLLNYRHAGAAGAA